MCVHAKSLQSCPTLCNTMDHSLPGSSVHAILQARILSTIPCPPPGNPTNPGIQPESLTSPALAGRFFISSATQEAYLLDGSVVSDFSQPQGLCSPWNSPGQNTGVGSLSRLQQIFPTQEEDQGLLHCRRILYQLSHQGRPSIRKRPQNLNQNDPSLLNLKGNNTCSSLNRDGRCGAVVFKHLHPHKQDLKAIIHQLCDLKQVTQCLWSHLFIWKSTRGLKKITGPFHPNALWFLDRVC